MDGQSGLSVKKLLELLPDTLLDRLAEEHRVNRQVKKLSGQLMFKLLLYMVVCSRRGSLNTLMAFFDNVRFRLFAGLSPGFETRRNSVADRLGQIEAAYFEAVLAHTSALCKRHGFFEAYRGYKVHRFDSTMVHLSARLLSLGMVVGRKGKDGEHHVKHVKFSIGFDGLAVKEARVQHEQTFVADDVALADVIRRTAVSADSVAVFDRGLKKRQAFADFSREGRLFVTRCNPTKTFILVEELSQSVGKVFQTLEIVSERVIRFANGVSQKKTMPCFRLIVAQKLDSGDQLFFLTNIFDLDALEITEIYKKRWDIEVFFRFLKQELNFTHLVSRTPNGIKVMACVTLIAAMLILLYRKTNQLKGYKIPKLRFENELETELIKELIILCNGDPNRLGSIIQLKE